MAIDVPAFQRDRQQQVIRELCVARHFDPNADRERRVAFVSDYLFSNSPRTDVLVSAVVSIHRRRDGLRN